MNYLKIVLTSFNAVRWIVIPADQIQVLRMANLPKLTHYVSQSFCLMTMFNRSPNQSCKNDCQPAVLDDELMETQHLDSQHIQTFPLTVIKEKV